MADVDLDKIDDEEELSKMLRKTDDMETRKKIRARMKEIRAKEAEEVERRRKERDTNKEDAVQMRLRHAEADKLKKMKEFEEMAKTEKTGKEDLVKQKHREAEERKQQATDKYHKEALEMTSGFNYSASDVLKKKGLDDPNKIVTSKTEETEDGGTKTTVTTTSEKSDDGGVTVTKQTRTVTKVSGFGGTSYGTPRRAGAAKKTGPRGARAAFMAMDKAVAPAGGAPKPSFLSAGGGGGGGGPKAGNLNRSPSAIKQMLLEWCRAMTKEYDNVDIKNFSSSWANGLAFCALIHHFRPDSFDYSALEPTNRRHNFKLAFDTAEREADVAQLLDVDDMVMMKNPDWKCVFTQVQMYYRRFRMDEMNQAKAAAVEES